MAWQIKVSASAEKQLAKLDRPVARRILAFLRERVAQLDDPRSVGEALPGSDLGEFWRYRIGDWRVICDMHNQQILITVLSLGNRREVYR
ncbi:MAG: type II toxin-antitoxin system RelE/ParE family toxin [Pseudomonadota bacterium]